MTEREELIARIFENAETLIDELSADNGEFNSQQFVRKVMKDQQKAYIEFLWYHKEDTHPFQQAHQEIGQELRRRAEGLGFTMLPKPIDVESIFFTPTTAMVYRRR